MSGRVDSIQKSISTLNRVFGTPVCALRMVDTLAGIHCSFGGSGPVGAAAVRWARGPTSRRKCARRRTTLHLLETTHKYSPTC